MGSPNAEGCNACADELPAHWVQLRPFYMQQHVVSNLEYARFDPKYRSRDPSDPAVNLTWYDALMYAVWIGGICRRNRNGNSRRAELTDASIRGGTTSRV